MAKGFGVDVNGDYLRGIALYDFIKEQNGGDTILLSFSCGKDSIAMWLELREHFNIIPYFMYWIPGMEFIEESISYYESFFGQRIMQLPHPLFWQYMNDFMYQPPQNVSIIKSLNAPEYDFDDIDKLVSSHYGFNPSLYCATGIRINDNMNRRGLIGIRGVAGKPNKGRKYFYAVWDWTIKQVADRIKSANCKIPRDYLVFGRTLAAWDYQILNQIKQNFPSDYNKMLNYFPLLDLEIFRYEQVGTWKNQ